MGQISSINNTIRLETRLDAIVRQHSSFSAPGPKSITGIYLLGCPTGHELNELLGCCRMAASFLHMGYVIFANDIVFFGDGNVI